MEFLAITFDTNYDRMEIYLPCCRKMMCYGCYDEILDGIRKRTLKCKCVLCWRPLSRKAEMTERCKERIEANDVHAFNVCTLSRVLGYGLSPGRPKTNKELELLKRGADIGSIEANYYLAEAYWYEQWNNIADFLSKRLGLLRDDDISAPYSAVSNILSLWLNKEGINYTGIELSLLKQVVKLVSSHNIAEYLARVINLRDMEKAIYHFEITAMGGNEIARFWKWKVNLNLWESSICRRQRLI